MLMTGPYQYAQAPGQGAYGYYEQQTPMGSFAAANQGNVGQAQYASNPFIGQTSQGIAGQQSVQPYAQQAVAASQRANPFVGQTTQQAQAPGANAYAGSNPYLTQAIDYASGDAIRNYQNATRPQLDAMARASGSFGNTAIQEMQQNAMSDLGQRLGGIASGMRMQDYTQQQGLAENALNRGLQNAQFNAGLNAADLSRNMAGFQNAQALQQQGFGQALGAAQFDANLGNNVNQFNAGLGAADLSRNAQLQQSLGQFNAGQGNQFAQFGANLQQANNQFNTGQANQMLSQQRQLGQQQGQFDANLDFNAWQANNQNMRQGQQDQLALLDRLLGWNTQGANTATQVQNTPLNYWQQFSNTGAQLGGLGGTNSQQLQGNPLLGGIGGALAGYNLYNQMTRGT